MCLHIATIYKYNLLGKTLWHTIVTTPYRVQFNVNNFFTQDVLVFPSDDCITVEQWVEKSKGNPTKTEANTEEDTESARKIVFIDCTWNQIHGIMRSPQLAGMVKSVG